MNANRLLALPLAAVLVLAACPALAAPAVDRAGLLTDDRGMTLYVYKRDTLGISRCYDTCIRPWLPYAASSAAKANGEFGIIRRDDGRAQWAYKGQPLYRFTGDVGRGDANGEHAGDRLVDGSREGRRAAGPRLGERLCFLSVVGRR